MKKSKLMLFGITIFCFIFLSSNTVFAASNGSSVNINLGGDWSDNINTMVIITLLMLAPSIIACVTAFPRYIISLSFLRQSIGIQNLPPNQILIGLAFFMTLFTMMPTTNAIVKEAYVPYTQKQITAKTAYYKAEEIEKAWMLKNTREKDLILFAKAANLKELPKTRQELDIRIVAPAFIISEFTKTFWIGFLLYATFIAIDLIVATVLMSMGMVMLPPMTVSILIKLLVFLSADGWYNVVKALMNSFS